MVMYVVPVGTIAAESTSILARTQVPVIAEGVLITKLMKAAAVSQSIVMLSDDELIVLTRNATHLTTEAPMALLAVPGLSYPGPWINVAARIHSMDWLTLEASLTKAGLVANDVKTLEKRASRDSVIESADRSIAAMFAEDDDGQDEDPLGPVEL